MLNFFKRRQKSKESSLESIPESIGQGQSPDLAIDAEHQKELSLEVLAMLSEYRGLLGEFAKRVTAMEQLQGAPDYEGMDALRDRIQGLRDQLEQVLKTPLEHLLKQLEPKLEFMDSFQSSMESMRKRQGRKRVKNPRHGQGGNEPKLITVDTEIGLVSPSQMLDGEIVPNIYEYTDIEGNTWPLSLDRAAEIVQAKLSTPEKKLWLDREFYEVVFVPICADIAEEAHNLGSIYMERAENGTLRRPDANGKPGEVIHATTDAPVPQRNEQMIYLTDELHKNRQTNESGGDSIDYGNLLYDQQGWEPDPSNANQPMKDANGNYVRRSDIPPTTKHDLIKEAKEQQKAGRTDVVPGWRVYLIHKPTLYNIPADATKAAAFGHDEWHPFHANKTPHAYSKAFFDPMLQGSSGMNIDLALTLATQIAHRDGMVMDDPNGAGKANYLTGNIFKDSGRLPYFDWNRNFRHLGVNCGYPDYQNAVYGVRSAVRLA